MKKQEWTDNEKLFLQTNAGIMKDKDLALSLNRTLKSIREMRVKLGIRKKSGRGVVALRD